MWLTSYMDLFLVEDDGKPSWLSLVGVSDIEWGEDIKEICRFCGEVVIGNKCSGCQSSITRSEHSLGCAYATLFGPLPTAASIFNIPEGSTIEIVYAEYGPRKFHHPDGVILRLLNCRIVERRMPNFVAISPEDYTRPYLYVKVRCEVELYPENGFYCNGKPHPLRNATPQDDDCHFTDGGVRSRPYPYGTVYPT